LGSIIIKIDLILLPLEGMDIMLGMNWMTLDGVTLDILARAVQINSPDNGATTLYLPFQECISPCTFAMVESEIEEIPYDTQVISVVTP
jgi:hypothetical protein